MKKNFIITALFILCFTSLFGATLKLKSGEYSLTRGEKRAISNTYEIENYFVEVKDRAKLNEMKKHGIEFLNYFGNSIWLVRGKVNKITSFAKGMLHYSYEMKISPLLSKKQIENETVSVYLFDKTQNKAFRKYLNNNNITFQEKDGYFNCYVNNNDQLKTIANNLFVMWISKKEPKKVVNNAEAQTMSLVDVVQHDPYNLSGEGETVGVWDGGEIFAHQEFGDRITLKDHSSAADHATHVAGTIGSAGEFDAKSEGMAPKVNIYSYDYNGNVNSELANAKMFFGIQVSNHSWGWSHDVADGWDIERFGDYEAYSSIQDKVAYENNLILVRSAGNSRSDFDDPQTIDPTSTSKNIITIGALYRDNEMTYYSSWGPCDDGRVKPDICAKGGAGMFTSLMYSTLPDNRYGYMQGTSMAAPVVTGSMALILEQYHKYNQGDIPAALAKGLILHTALDLYNLGPDYMTGFGILQVQPAIDFLKGSNYGEGTDHTIIKSVVDNGETKTYTFNVTESKNMRVTACWTDVEGSPSASKALVNDVDIKVISPTEVEYFPYVLDPNNPTADATKGVNSVDNVEQIDFLANEEGTWTIEVKGTDIDSLNIPEVYVFVDSYVKTDRESLPKVKTNLHSDVKYSGLHIIKSNVDDVFSFNAHVFDDDGYIKSVNWNFVNIPLDSSKANAGDFTLTSEHKVYGYSLIATDNNSNTVKDIPTYILLEDKEGMEQLPENGISDVSIGYGEVKTYYTTFPLGAIEPKIETTGTGDIDIFVSYLNAPAVSYNSTSGDYEFTYSHPLMFSSTSSDGNETVTLSSPLKEDGIWCIQVYGWENTPMTFSLTATYKEPLVYFPDTEITSPKSTSLTVPINSKVMFSANGTDDLGVDTVKWKKGLTNLGEGFTQTVEFTEEGTVTIKATAVNRGGSEDLSPAEFNVTVVSEDNYPEAVYCPLVYQNNVYDTYLYLLNLTTSTNSVIMLALNDYGSIVASKSVSLNAGEKQVYKVGDIFPNTKFVTGVKIISSYPVSGFVRVMTKNNGDKQGAALFVKAYEKSIVPHIHKKQNSNQWGTSFGLIADNADSVYFEYFSGVVDKIAGNYSPFSIKQRFTALFDLNMPEEQIWGYFGTATNQNIAGMEMFEKVDGNQQQTLLSLNNNTFTECYLAHTTIKQGWWTGLSLVNPNDETTYIKISAYTSEGALLSEKEFSLKAKGRKVDLIQNFFDVEIPDTIAWVKIQSTLGVAGYELFGYVNNEQIAGINILGHLSSKIAFLHVSDDENGWTGVVVLNPTNSTVNVTFKAYNSNGELLAETENIAVMSGHKYLGLVSNLFPSIENISYIEAESDTDNSICGFELFGTTLQIYLNGIEAVSLQ